MKMRESERIVVGKIEPSTVIHMDGKVIMNIYSTKKPNIRTTHIYI